jgi:uncharacterized membrane protein YoaK (UPF0700 family)
LSAGASDPTPPAPEGSLVVAALITLPGGFLDAFTYVGHGHVFANAISGNVVLLGVAGAASQWSQATRHLAPILAYLAGIVIARMLTWPKMVALLQRPALACLLLETVFLFGAAWLPANFPDVVLVPGIAFTAALQFSTFARVGDYTYTSVVTTGNLRRLADGTLLALSGPTRQAGLRQARIFGLLCADFLAGAVLGALGTSRFGNLALLVPGTLLGAAAGVVARSPR